MSELRVSTNIETKRSDSGLRGSLGVSSIVLMVVATAAPLSVMVANTPLIISMGNSSAAPFYALVATIIMLLFATGFTAMARHISNAGAFYSYIQKGLGRVIGLGAATTALISYFLILIALETYLGYAIGDLLKGFFGVELPWWPLSFAVVAVVGFLGYRDIELSSKFLNVALVLEISIVLIVNGAILYRHGLSGMDVTPLKLTTAAAGSPGLGIMWAIYSFIGFEATVIFREEAKDPDRTIPLATYVAVIAIGLFYITSMWLEVVGVGATKVIAMANAHPGDMYQIIIRNYLGTSFESCAQILLVSSLFACVLSLHNVVVRYQYILGRYGVLHFRLGDVHKKHGSPHISSLVQTLSSVIVLVIVIALKLDPVTQTFAWGGTAGTLGYMVILCLACLSVMAFFSKKANQGGFWRTKVAPAGGLLGVLFCLYIAIQNLPSLVGGDGAKTAAWVMCVVIAFAFCFGCFAAVMLWKFLPNRFRALKELA